MRISDWSSDVCSFDLWTAQTSGPVAIWQDERPRSTWLEQHYLAERLAPEPRLIPADLDDRTLMFGLCNELCSENGFGWNLRLKTTHRMLNDPNASEMAKAISPVLARRYHYDAAPVDRKSTRMNSSH